MAENPSSFLRQRTATLPFSPLHGEGRGPFFLSRQRTATLPFSPLHDEGRVPFFLSRQRTATLPFSPLHDEGRVPFFLSHHSTVRAEYPSSFLTTPRLWGITITIFDNVLLAQELNHDTDVKGRKSWRLLAAGLRVDRVAVYTAVTSALIILKAAHATTPSALHH
ncbi:hypothetical protein M5K25_014056 [Dendrobium thyrsiflorum]|uniref:Uncharacterized protein n=1 Tax=Dendrobium thyrsiflorum TaxID=117978 RepID=A0ABD0UVT1_DENTH